MICRRSRWVQVFKVVSDVECPSGHRFKTVEMWSDEDLVCDHRGRDGREDCGRRVYLAPLLRLRGQPLLMAVEVSALEMQELNKFKSGDDILDYLYGLLKERAA